MHVIYDGVFSLKDLDMNYEKVLCSDFAISMVQVSRGSLFLRWWYVENRQSFNT